MTEQIESVTEKGSNAFDRMIVGFDAAINDDNPGRAAEILRQYVHEHSEKTSNPMRESMKITAAWMAAAGAGIYNASQTLTTPEGLEALNKVKAEAGLTF